MARPRVRASVHDPGGTGPSGPERTRPLRYQVEWQLFPCKLHRIVRNRPLQSPSRQCNCSQQGC
eukprot:9967240-Lingulodinium_polyedra.AAC.1